MKLTIEQWNLSKAANDVDDDESKLWSQKSLAFEKANDLDPATSLTLTINEEGGLHDLRISARGETTQHFVVERAVTPPETSGGSASERERAAAEEERQRFFLHLVSKRGVHVLVHYKKFCEREGEKETATT